MTGFLSRLTWACYSKTFFTISCWSVALFVNYNNRAAIRRLLQRIELLCSSLTQKWMLLQSIKYIRFVSRTFASRLGCIQHTDLNRVMSVVTVLSGFPHFSPQFGPPSKFPTHQHGRVKANTCFLWDERSYPAESWPAGSHRGMHYLPSSSYMSAQTTDCYSLLQSGRTVLKRFLAACLSLQWASFNRTDLFINHLYERLHEKFGIRENPFSFPVYVPECV